MISASSGVRVRDTTVACRHSPTGSKGGAGSRSRGPGLATARHDSEHSAPRGLGLPQAGDCESGGPDRERGAGGSERPRSAYAGAGRGGTRRRGCSSSQATARLRGLETLAPSGAAAIEAIGAPPAPTLSRPTRDRGSAATRPGSRVSRDRPCATRRRPAWSRPPAAARTSARPRLQERRARPARTRRPVRRSRRTPANEVVRAAWSERSLAGASAPPVDARTLRRETTDVLEPGWSCRPRGCCARSWIRIESNSRPSVAHPAGRPYPRPRGSRPAPARGSRASSALVRRVAACLSAPVPW